MFARKAFIITVLLATAACADVPPPAGAQPAGPPAPVAQLPPLKADATADDVLDALDARGKSLDNFSGTLTSTDEDLVMNGDPVVRTGTIVFEKDPKNTRLHLNYVQKKFGKRVTNERKEYLLDGVWLTDRDYMVKTETVRQVAKVGDTVNLFQLGKGPLPLPIGQKKEAVKKEFDVEIIAPVKQDPAHPDQDFVPDPANSIHTRLKPKANTPLADSFFRIDVWVDRTTDFPVRIVTRDKRQAADKTHEFSDLTINAKMNNAAFVLDGIEKDWKSSQIPLGR